jgi:hypothetical protein
MDRDIHLGHPEQQRPWHRDKGFLTVCLVFLVLTVSDLVVRLTGFGGGTSWANAVSLAGLPVGVVYLLMLRGYLKRKPDL